MSDWMYCNNCRQGMPEPLIREAIYGFTQCLNCETINEPGKTTEDILIELLDRIEALEELK